MKKFLGFLALGLIIYFTPLTAYSLERQYGGPTTIEEAKERFFKGQKLDLIEGIWFQEDEGAIYAVVKVRQGVYEIWTIEHKVSKYNGTRDKHEGLRKTATNTIYTYKTTIYNIDDPSEEAVGSGTWILKNDNFIESHVIRGCWSTNRCWSPMDSYYIRMWPDDLQAYNEKIKGERAVKWKKVAVSVNGGITAYVDTQSMKKKNDIVFFTQLDSIKEGIEVDGITAYSDIQKFEGNCANNEMRFLKSVYYSDNMGIGNIILTNDRVSGWSHYEKSSVLGVVLNYVCLNAKVEDSQKRYNQPNSSSKESDDDWF